MFLLMYRSALFPLSGASSAAELAASDLPGNRELCEPGGELPVHVFVVAFAYLRGEAIASGFLINLHFISGPVIQS